MKKHSKLGIISFIIAIVFIIYSIIMAYIDIMQIFNRTQIIPNNIFLLGSTFFMIMLPFGAGLGLAAILEKNTKKGFAISGLIINSLFSLLTVMEVITKVL